MKWRAKHDEDEEGDDQEDTNSSGEEDNQSVNLTTPHKYPKEASNIKKFNRKKCQESLFHQAFLNAHILSKHSSLNGTESIPEKAINLF